MEALANHLQNDKYVYTTNNIINVDPQRIVSVECLFGRVRLCLHGFQMDPVQKLDHVGLLFTRYRSGTGPERSQPKLDLLFADPVSLSRLEPGHATCLET